jgi:hypothetical protein
VSQNTEKNCKFSPGSVILWFDVNCRDAGFEVLSDGETVRRA